MLAAVNKCRLSAASSGCQVSKTKPKRVNVIAVGRFRRFAGRFGCVKCVCIPYTTMNFSMQTVAVGDSGDLGRVIRRRGDSSLVKKLEATPLEVMVPRIAVVDDDEAIHLFLKDLG